MHGWVYQMPAASSTRVSDSGHPSCHGLTAGAAAEAACAKVLNCHVLQAEL